MNCLFVIGKVGDTVPVVLMVPQNYQAAQSITEVSSVYFTATLTLPYTKSQLCKLIAGIVAIRDKSLLLGSAQMLASLKHGKLILNLCPITSRLPSISLIVFVAHSRSDSFYSKDESRESFPASTPSAFFNKSDRNKERECDSGKHNLSEVVGSCSISGNNVL